MKTPKYKISANDITTPSGVHKLERDGHSKEAIHRALYKHTEGASHRDKERILGRLYDRKE